MRKVSTRDALIELTRYVVGERRSPKNRLREPMAAGAGKDRQKFQIVALIHLIELPTPHWLLPLARFRLLPSGPSPLNRQLSTPRPSAAGQ